LISFRFHLVTIVAIFLALAVGVVVGSTVIDQGIVDTLENRVEDVRANLEARERVNDELRQEVEDLESFVEDSARFSVTGRLTDAVAVVVVDRGIDNAPVDRTIELLDQAGAAVRGVLTVQPAWDLDDEERQASLAEAVGLDADEPVPVLQARAAELLVADLASPVEVVDDGNGALDDITALRLVDYDVRDEEVIAEDPSDVIFVVISGPESAITTPDHTTVFVEPAVEAAGSVLQAEVWTEQEDGFERADSLAPIFGDPDLAAEVSTVDDLDLPMGPTTAVLALAAAQEGEVGHFGVGDTADEAAPFPPGSS
jgi:hypothetical protein